MKLKDFETDIIGLAHRGVRLTVPNVVARLAVDREKAERWLDELAAAGRLEVEIDESCGVVFYRVPGLSPGAAERRPAAGLRRDAAAAYRELSDEVGRRPLARGAGRRKSVLLGGLLGLLFPGIGLLYAAPWLVALGATLLALVVFKLTWIPIIGWALGATAAVASAMAGGLYAARYNERGERAPLGRAPQRLHRPPAG